MSDAKRFKVADLYHSCNQDTIVVNADQYDTAQSQLAALREELAEIKESLAYRGSLLGRTEHRLADAERRNADVTKERDFLLEQFREMSQAKPYAMVELSHGPYQRAPGVDPYKWFWWNGEARPIYKGALCDVVLSDGSIHFNVRPGFDWSGYGDIYVVAARHGPNLDGMEDVDRPAARIYAALNPNPEAASHE